jgi:hypothetical protein
VEDRFSLFWRCPARGLAAVGALAGSNWRPGDWQPAFIQYKQRYITTEYKQGISKKSWQAGRQRLTRCIEQEKPPEGGF